MAEPISSDDVMRAVEKLKVLGGGFGLTKVGVQTYIQSVPGELNIDTSKVLQVAQVRWQQVTARCLHPSNCASRRGDM